MRGAQDRTCSLQETGRLQGACGKQVGTLCWAGIIPDSAVWAGEGLEWGTGRAPWGAGTGFAAPREEAAIETPKAAVLRGGGEEQHTWGDTPELPFFAAGQPILSFRAAGDREGTHCSGGLTVVWGSSAFRLLSTPVVQSSALGQPCTLCIGWRWPLCAGGEETPQSKN